MNTENVNATAGYGVKCLYIVCALSEIAITKLVFFAVAQAETYKCICMCLCIKLSSA